MLWVQGVAGGAEDWYELLFHGAACFWKKTIVSRFSLMSDGSDLKGSQPLRKRYCSFKWKMLKNAEARRILLEDFNFFLLGNSLIILHEVVILGSG